MRRYLVFATPTKPVVREIVVIAPDKADAINRASRALEDYEGNAFTYKAHRVSPELGNNTKPEIEEIR